MREFFRGCRRKIGVLTLMMACVFIAIWGWCQNNATTIDVWCTATTECNLSPSSEGFKLFNGQIAFVTGLRQLNRIWEIDVSHWSIVILLTVLSAYLLLSKPRVAKSVAVHETISRRYSVAIRENE